MLHFLHTAEQNVFMSFSSSDGLWDPQKWFHASFGGSRQNSPLELVDCHNHRSTEPDRTHLGPTRKNSHCTFPLPAVWSSVIKFCVCFYMAVDEEQLFFVYGFTMSL